MESANSIPTLSTLKKQVSEFNAQNPVGSPVDVYLRDGSQFRAKVRRRAIVMDKRATVVWVEGQNGCFSLSNVCKPGAGAKP